jgi:hypothetical protein
MSQHFTTYSMTIEDKLWSASLATRFVYKGSAVHFVRTSLPLQMGDKTVQGSVYQAEEKPDVFYVVNGDAMLKLGTTWAYNPGVGRAELRKQLESGGKSVSASVPAKNSVLSSDWIGLTVEAKRKRCGGEVHLVVPPNSSVSREHRKLPLIKAVARAHGWYEKVVQGKAVDIRSLARDAGLADRYVRKVLRSAFLAPDIVESILAGHQPRDLNFEKLCQNLPSSWVEQRELLGFSPAITRRPPRSPIQ